MIHIGYVQLLYRVLANELSQLLFFRQEASATSFGQQLSSVGRIYTWLIIIGLSILGVPFVKIILLKRHCHPILQERRHFCMRFSHFDPKLTISPKL